MKWIDRLADKLAIGVPFTIKKAYIRWVMRHHNKSEREIEAYINTMERF